MYRLVTLPYNAPEPQKMVQQTFNNPPEKASKPRKSKKKAEEEEEAAPKVGPSPRRLAQAPIGLLPSVPGGHNDPPALRTQPASPSRLRSNSAAVPGGRMRLAWCPGALRAALRCMRKPLLPPPFPPC